jgi:hypothetical protein
MYNFRYPFVVFAAMIFSVFELKVKRSMLCKKHLRYTLPSSNIQVLK